MHKFVEKTRLNLTILILLLMFTATLIGCDDGSKPGTLVLKLTGVRDTYKYTDAHDQPVSDSLVHIISGSGPNEQVFTSAKLRINGEYSFSKKDLSPGTWKININAYKDGLFDSPLASKETTVKIAAGKNCNAALAMKY